MKLHLCCGDVYLKGYINCDIVGEVIEPHNRALIVEGAVENPNETTLDNYFKFPFEKNLKKRKRRKFIIDKKMNILDKWKWKNNSIDEIVMINSLEHFTYNEVLYIIDEVKRVLKLGGIFKFDFPDIKEIVDLYYDQDPEFCMSLIYCNHKNEYSIHKWGYTKKSIKKYFPSKDWLLIFRDVVKHDYPSQGVWAIKRSKNGKKGS